MTDLIKCPNCLKEGFDSINRVCTLCDYDEKHDPNFNLKVQRHLKVKIDAICETYNGG